MQQLFLGWPSQYSWTVRVGEPERDVGNKDNPSKVIEDIVGGNSDSYPMSGISRNCIAGCCFREQDVFELVISRASVI